MGERDIWAKMMPMVQFVKWEGSGNDFILIDDRAGSLRTPDTAAITRMCDRHFGVGSDGLILLRGSNDPDTAFVMDFFNPDGSQSFCGNGSRCAFAFHTKLTGDRDPVRFHAIDGPHDASWEGEQVRIGMRSVRGVERMDTRTDLMDTGSPHLVRWVEDPFAIDVVREGRAIRNNDRFRKEGINVNFVRWTDGRLQVRTYERGVENETLSCGTGVTAAALSAMARGDMHVGVEVVARGGCLRVEAEHGKDGGFTNVHLIGPVNEVFSGGYPMADQGIGA